MKRNIFNKLLILMTIAMSIAAVSFSSVSAFAMDMTPKQNYYRTVESDAEGWTWTGFGLIESDKASKNWEYGTYSAGGTGEYRFKGDSVQIISSLVPDGGRLGVKIDDIDKGEVSLYSESEEYKAVAATFGGLTFGWHTIKITSLDEGKWHSVDAIKVNVSKDAYVENYNLALIGDIICSVPNPTGGGNKDLNVIRNEKFYPVGTSGAGPAQYDSFNGSGRGYFYMGYAFKEEIPFSKLVFQEGDTWVDGGWFSDGDVKVQVRKNGTWKDVELQKSTGYPSSDVREDFGQSCEVYTFVFDTITGDAIRLIGMTGGTSNFVSVSQIEVYSNANALTLSEGYNYRKATIYENAQPQNPDKPGKKGGCKSSVSGVSAAIALAFICVTTAMIAFLRNDNKKRIEK